MDRARGSSDAARTSAAASEGCAPLRRSRRRLHAVSFPRAGWGTRVLVANEHPHPEAAGAASSFSSAVMPSPPSKKRPRNHGKIASNGVGHLEDPSDCSVVVDDQNRVPSEPATAGGGKPWNLRKRKAATSADSNRCFSLSLTQEEINQDLIKIFGALPTAKPKKRSLRLQKILDNIYPGTYLVEITADRYKIRGER